jgi:hypothetical protein
MSPRIPEAVTPTTPLRLEIACQLAFPDSSVSASALRRMVVTGKVEAEFIAGKYYVTLAAIEEMRKQCRVKAKDPASPSTVEKCGSSATDKSTAALDAMNKTAMALKENLRTTSSKSTTRPKRSAKVIPILQK